MNASHHIRKANRAGEKKKLEVVCACVVSWWRERDDHVRKGRIPLLHLFEMK